MKKKTILKILRILLGIDLLLSGVLFMFGANWGVTDFVEIIERLGYPPYSLGAIGFGKLLMGLVLLIAKDFRIRTYAYFALLLNLFLAIYSHIGAGDAISDMGPAIGTLIFGVVVFYLDFSTGK